VDIGRCDSGSGWIIIFVDMPSQIPFVGIVLGVVARVTEVAYEAANRKLRTDGRRPRQPKKLLQGSMGKDEIIMPVTSLVSAGEAEVWILVSLLIPPALQRTVSLEQVQLVPQLRCLR
jgi:hypothetical protein